MNFILEGEFDRITLTADTEQELAQLLARRVVAEPDVILDMARHAWVDGEARYLLIDLERVAG